MANNKLTGTVTVNASTGEGCIAVIPVSGTKISCKLLFDSAGARTLTATYAGDAGDLSSVSTPGYANRHGWTTTKITKHTPDPAKVGHTVTVDFSVSGKYGTKTTDPTGSVTVNASTGESCSGTVSKAGTGKCQITFGSIGVRTLVASYPATAITTEHPPQSSRAWNRASGDDTTVQIGSCISPEIPAIRLTARKSASDNSDITKVCTKKE